MVSRNFNVWNELFFSASKNVNVGQSWNTLKSLHPTCSGEISHSDQNQVITHRGVNKPSHLPIRLWPSILYISVDFLPGSFYEDSFLLGRTCRYNNLLLRNTPLGESWQMRWKKRRRGRWRIVSSKAPQSIQINPWLDGIIHEVWVVDRYLRPDENVFNLWRDLRTSWVNKWSQPLLSHSYPNTANYSDWCWCAGRVFPNKNKEGDLQQLRWLIPYSRRRPMIHSFRRRRGKTSRVAKYLVHPNATDAWLGSQLDNCQGISPSLFQTNMLTHRPMSRRYFNRPCLISFLEFSITF